MKTFIKFLAISFLVIGFSNVLLAQQDQHQRKDPPSIEERVNRVIKIIEKKIELSESEKQSIENAFIDFYKTIDEVLESGEKPERSVMEEYEKERDSKIKLALSEEKFEDYLRITCYLRPQHEGNNKRHPNAGKPVN